MYSEGVSKLSQPRGFEYSKDIRTVLKWLGFTEIPRTQGGKGSHTKFKHADGRMVTLGLTRIIGEFHWANVLKQIFPWIEGSQKDRERIWVKARNTKGRDPNTQPPAGWEHGGTSMHGVTAKENRIPSFRDFYESKKWQNKDFDLTNKDVEGIQSINDKEGQEALDQVKKSYWKDAGTVKKSSGDFELTDKDINKIVRTKDDEGEAALAKVKRTINRDKK